jgi:hypothetical protein
MTTLRLVLTIMRQIGLLPPRARLVNSCGYLIALKSRNNETAPSRAASQKGGGL